MELTVLANTVLKPSTDQASTLPANVLIPVEKGKVLPILAYLEEDGHLKITLDPAKIDCKALGGKNTHWIYGGHIEDPAGFGPSNNPKDQPPAPAKAGMGTPFTLPGYQGRYWSGMPIHSSTPGFVWAEALHFGPGGSYRKPDNAAQVNNIIRAAKGMQAIRDKLGGRSIRITSWLRPHAINKAVGGASQSRHLSGDGVDFAVEGMTPAQVFAALDSWHGGAGGLAQGGRMGFTHVDWRGNGQRARWTYPGA